MLVASLQFLAAEFEERLLLPVAALKLRPVAALELLVDLYLDPDIASPRKVSVWYAFWGEASSRQEYYDICGQKDESFAALVRELIERLIAQTSQRHLDPDGIALGLIGVLEILWQDFAFKNEHDIDRTAAKRRCMAYLRSVFPGKFSRSAEPPAQVTNAPATGSQIPAWAYQDPRIHAMERERFFRNAWTVIGHESQIPRAGDFLSIDVGAERVLVVRDSMGGVHALRNSCPEAPHTLVARRSGRFDDGIACAVHGLHFTLNGRRSGKLGRVDMCALDLSSVGGLMFVKSPTLERGPDILRTPRAWLESDPTGMTALGSPLEIPVAADWKVVVEQWLESASLDFALSPEVDNFVWHAAIVGDSRWSGRLYARLVEFAVQRAWRRQFIAPNQLIETRPDGLSIVQVLPLGPGRCLLRRLDFTLRASTKGAHAVRYLAQRLAPFSRKSTLGVAESIQRGMVEFGYEVVTGGAESPAVDWFRQRLKQSIPALGLQRPPTDS